MQIRSDFAAACAILGLTAPAVAEIVDVRPDTARQWITGRRNPPPAAWAALSDMYRARLARPDGDPCHGEARLSRALARLRGV